MGRRRRRASTELRFAAAPFEDAQAFNGTWQGDESMVHLRHAGQGRLVLAHLEWKADNRRFELLQDTVVLGRVGDATVLKLPKDGAPGWYYFVIVRLAEGGHLLAWLGTVQAYADAVGAGRIEGTTERKSGQAIDVRITSEKAAFDAFLAEQPLSAMVDLEHPAVLRRVPGLPD